MLIRTPNFTQINIISFKTLTQLIFVQTFVSVQSNFMTANELLQWNYTVFHKKGPFLFLL